MYQTIRKQNEAACYETLQRDLNNVDIWAKKWLVNFNPKKTESMLITRKDSENVFKHDLYFQNQQIQNVTHHIHIGLTYSADATWKLHLTNIQKRVAKRIDILRSLKWKLDRKSLEIIYYSFIRPLFEYADIVWDSAPLHDYLYQSLEKLQIDACRIVTGTTRYSSKNLLYCDTGWLPLTTRRTTHRLTLFYKIVNDICPRHLKSRLANYNNYRGPYNTRHRNNFATM